VVAAQLQANRAVLENVTERFRLSRPRFVSTNARGSSDAAATYAKYLIETRLGLPVVSSAPSVGAIYGAPVRLENSILLSISQSGASFDLVENARFAKSRGAFLVSLLNAEHSPLAEVSDIVVPLGAGKESGIAATKSHVASLSAVLQLVAYVGCDSELLGLLRALPDQLEHATQLDWAGAVDALGGASRLLVVARGLSLGAAQEAALKFKETCDLHAEAFSGAELEHGPIALVREGSPVLLFSQSDETQPGQFELARNLCDKGAHVLSAGLPDAACGAGGREIRLPVVAGAHPVVAPLLFVQAVYGLVDLVAKRRGLDPDAPPHLNKVTRTR
jgi:glucosamine--fructose-6-phosphate aminotransferase (isomerizing)